MRGGGNLKNFKIEFRPKLRTAPALFTDETELQLISSKNYLNPKFFTDSNQISNTLFFIISQLISNIGFNSFG